MQEVLEANEVSKNDMIYMHFIKILPEEVWIRREIDWSQGDQVIHHFSYLRMKRCRSEGSSLRQCIREEAKELECR